MHAAIEEQVFYPVAHGRRLGRWRTSSSKASKSTTSSSGHFPELDGLRPRPGSGSMPRSRC